jgi:hypothetical protein
MVLTVLIPLPTTLEFPPLKLTVGELEAAPPPPTVIV